MLKNAANQKDLNEDDNIIISLTFLTGLIYQ